MNHTRTTTRTDDDAFRAVASEIHREAPVPHPWESLDMVRTRSVEREPRGVHRGLLAVAAVSMLAAGVAGTIAIVDRDNVATAPAASERLPEVESAAAVSLSSVDAVGNNQWIVPSRLGDGATFQHAYSYGGVGRNIQYGTDTSSETLSIFVGPQGAPYSPGTDVDIGGRVWSISVDDGFGVATLSIGDNDVQVTGVFESTSELAVLVEGLVVVDSAQLPDEPLTYSTDSMTPVATFDVDDTTVQITAEGAGGWYCINIIDGQDAGGGGCGTFFDPADHLLLYSTGSRQDATADRVIRAEASGLASADVVRVEIDWLDGMTSTVVPQNTSDQFTDVKFWATRTPIDLPAGQDTDSITEFVTEIRAIDQNGEVLATIRDGELVNE